MRLKEMMKPWDGETVCCEGLNQDRDLYSLRPDEIEGGGERIAIVGRGGEKTGEIKREILRAVLESADIYLVNALMDTFPEGIVALDEKGIIFYANQMYSKILGVPIGKILGRSMYKIEPYAAVLTVLETREPVTLEHQYIRTLGHYISCRISPIFRDGVFRGALSVFSDATEIVKLNEEIRRVNQVAIDLQHQVQVMDKAQSMELIGKSPVFSNIISQAAVVAPTDAPVLIRGENGTGKEVIAKFIHANSSRAGKPLITVNCASIPENLVESELFGYEAGAFTGANRGGKMGKFEMASGGTLFLDEIGDMPITMQTKLLRAIQENEIEKVGGRSVAVDVRIITATNQPLEQMIEEKTFRRDLYYRINTVTLRIPPLRERREDILLFADHFLKKYNEKYGKSVAFSESVLRWFMEHSWPGNVREMKNCIENGVILCTGGVFGLDWLTQYRQERGGETQELAGQIQDSQVPLGQETYTQEPAGQEQPWQRKTEQLSEHELQSQLQLQAQLFGRTGADAAAARSEASGTPALCGGTLQQRLYQAEEEILRQALHRCEGSRTEAMRLLGLTRRTFYRKLSEHGLTGRRRE